MADNTKFVGGKKFKLAGSGITQTQTTITLQEFQFSDGTTITMTNFGDKGHGTLEPGTQKREFITWTGVTQNVDGTAQLTGVTRGVRPFSPYTSDTTNFAYSHGGGTIFIVSNTPSFYDELSGKDNDESMTGVWTFATAAPPRLSATHAYVAGEELFLATKEYVDSVAAFGAPLMSTTVAGIGEEATQAEVEAGTDIGGTGARLIVNPSTIRARRYHSFASDSVGTDAYAITVTPSISAYTDGDIFTFEAGTVNTGNATLNVNAVGAKNILKHGNITLSDGDIKAGSIVMVAYDADSDTFMLLTPVAWPQISAGNKEIYAASATGNDTYVVTYNPAPTAYATGGLYIFKADVANTGAATLNVNGIGAKSILRPDGSALANGDIAAGQIVIVAYDGTNLLMVSTLANTPLAKVGTTTYDISTASGVQNIAHGLGRIPKKVRINAWYVPGANQSAARADVTYDGTTAAGLSESSVVLGLTSGVSVGTTVNIALQAGGGQSAVITFDATNIILTWTKSGTPTGTIQIAWEAYV